MVAPGANVRPATDSARLTAAIRTAAKGVVGDELRRLYFISPPHDPRRPRAFGVLSSRASRTRCLVACQVATPPDRTGTPVAALATISAVLHKVPNGYCGLAGCAISLPDPNRAAATASAG